VTKPLEPFASLAASGKMKTIIPHLAAGTVRFLPLFHCTRSFLLQVLVEAERVDDGEINEKAPSRRRWNLEGAESGLIPDEFIVLARRAMSTTESRRPKKTTCQGILAAHLDLRAVN